MLLARKPPFLVDPGKGFRFLGLIEGALLLKLFTAFRGKFDGVRLQATNKARKHLMTPCFLGIFECPKVQSN